MHATEYCQCFYSSRYLRLSIYTVYSIISLCLVSIKQLQARMSDDCVIVSGRLLHMWYWRLVYSTEFLVSCDWSATVWRALMALEKVSCRCQRRHMSPTFRCDVILLALLLLCLLTSTCSLPILSKTQALVRLSMSNLKRLNHNMHYIRYKITVGLRL